MKWAIWSRSSSDANASSSSVRRKCREKWCGRRRDGDVFREFLLVHVVGCGMCLMAGFKRCGIVALLSFFFKRTSRKAAKDSGSLQASADHGGDAAEKLVFRADSDRWRHQLNRAPRPRSPIAALVCSAVGQMAAQSQSLCLSTLRRIRTGGGLWKLRAASACALGRWFRSLRVVLADGPSSVRA